MNLHWLRNSITIHLSSIKIYNDFQCILLYAIINIFLIKFPFNFESLSDSSGICVTHQYINVTNNFGFVTLQTTCMHKNLHNTLNERGGKKV